MIPCYVLEATDRASISLRRYASGSTCTGAMSYHDARLPIGTAAVRLDPRGCWDIDCPDAPPHNDPRWPSCCSCGYQFVDADEWQVFDDIMYKRLDTGEEMTLRDAPPGALWRALWLEGRGSKMWVGVDGQAWMCRTPGGDWHIDGPASNCTDPEGQRRGDHKCWVRKGTAPNFTVSKDGPTCGAGAGSILCGGYHGFLQNGHLT